jgi:dihydrofolate reductase
MGDSMSLNQLPLTIIVAATLKGGIGKSGGLPWPMLKKDMAYFARVTKRVPTSRDAASVPGRAKTHEPLSIIPPRQNVVIMGRKTWDSIPPKFRPLKDRTNVVISSQDPSKLDSIPGDVVVATDITSALKTLEQFVENGRAPPVGRAFVIGGTSIYTAALELPQTSHILMTRIGHEYDCDTFFPLQLDHAGGSHAWERKPHAELQEFVEEDVDEGPQAQQIGDDAVTVDFHLYARKG